MAELDTITDHRERQPTPSCSPEISVIICTKDRPADLTTCLDSVARQTTQPTELIVVDASTVPVDDTIAAFRSRIASRFTVTLLHTSPGLTAQRNIGVRAASAPVLLFLDDDTVLDPDYIKEIAAVYASDPACRIGGVGGSVSPDPVLTERFLNRVFSRVFLLRGVGRGRLKRSGHADVIFQPRELMQVDVLSGCNMSYRRCVFESLAFDERLTGYALGEDMHFSYAVSRRWTLLLTPHARIEHRETGTGRPAPGDKQEIGVVHHFLFFREQVATDPFDWVCYFWSLLGRLLLTLRHPGQGRLAGVLRGYRRIARSLITGDSVSLRSRGS